MKQLDFIWNGLFLLSFQLTNLGAAAPVDLSGLAPDGEVRFRPDFERLTVEWPAGPDGLSGVARFHLSAEQPLIESLGLRSRAGGDIQVIAEHLSPYLALTVGQRDLTRNGWTVFFDKVHTRPSQRHTARLTATSVVCRSGSARGTLAFEGLSAGPFSGRWEFHFYSGSPLVHVEAVLRTDEDRRAIIYEAGFVARPGAIERFHWIDPVTRQAVSSDPSEKASPLAVRHRTVAAATDSGAVAVFPAPHRFFYPLDFADNFDYNWRGRDWDPALPGAGWGIRQPPEGDRRFVPWVNAPPGTEQRLGFFSLLTTQGPAPAIESVQRYTRGDRFASLPGYKTFTSHYHVEHALDLIGRQSAAGRGEIPADLRNPGFVRAFREMGVDVVHLAEFHRGATPRLNAEERLAELRLLHDECARLSNDEFLLLPGEEPNVHLGGHWISFFPKPVHWVLNRPNDQPFRQETDRGETLYHVGSPEEILELMRRENGLMWTAHARIKSSIAYPDGYRGTEFYRSPHFFGAAWKAMPADYSRDRLGWRVLDLLDDMANWGGKKYVLGEVDVFKVEPHYELYGHMNINYLRLGRLPRFEEGWDSILNALRAGDFFVTTGEILIPEFTVGGARAGQTVAKEANGEARVRAQLQWTFPLLYAEIIAGDGERVFRHRVELTDAKEFGSTTLERVLPAQSYRWLRLEVWDIAANGAFTQPVWFGE